MHATRSREAFRTAIGRLAGQALPLPPNQPLQDRPHHSPYRRFVHWIVDGMNVIGTRPDGWWRDRRRAMAELVDRLERWAETGGDDVTVVFEQPPTPPIHSSVITVAHAPRAAADSADDEIVRLVQADHRPQDIRVATSDSRLSDRIRAAGASVYPAESLHNLIDPL